MKKYFAPKKSVPSFVMFFTIVIAVSIPLMVLSLNGETTFDIRNQAYETASPTLSNPCVVYLPKVNPSTLEKDGTYDVSVEAISDVKDIEGITILDEDGNTLFNKDYTSLVNSVEETFSYTPTSTGTNFLRGTLKKVGDDVACSGVSLAVINKNTKPSLTSSTSNFNLTYEDEFSYTITAEDPDKDIINYFYSFTPNVKWLKAVVLEDGTSGKLQISFKGTPTEPASYLLHIFIHDGYGNHLGSIAWIINVGQGENDIPVVEILDPSTSISITSGDSVYTKWIASDLNQIVKYQLYIVSDPSNTETWTSIDDDISYRTTEYTLNTSGLTNGVYQLIVRAVDNQDPSGIGMDVSSPITISGGSNSSDDVIISEPQIINVSPNNSSEVENTQPIIRATLVASKDSTIDEDSIIFKLNDKEISDNVRFNKISDSEITLIYQPEEDLDSGIQQVEISFSDTSGQNVNKSWTFTVTGSTEEENTDTISILGIEIGKKTALIIGAGFVVMILAILIPILIYKIWSGGNNSTEVTNKELPPKLPSSGNMYNFDTGRKEISTPLVKEDEIEEKPLQTFSAPSLDDMKNEIPSVEEKTVQPDMQIEEAKEEKETWTPKVSLEETSANTEIPAEPMPEEQKAEEIKTDIPQSEQVIPDLQAPSPEMFTQAPKQDEQTIDDIAKLYEEIQKVESSPEETNPAPTADSTDNGIS